MRVLQRYMDNDETTPDRFRLAFPRTKGAKNTSRLNTKSYCTPIFAIFIPRVCPFLHNSSGQICAWQADQESLDP